MNMKTFLILAAVIFIIIIVVARIIYQLKYTSAGIVKNEEGNENVDPTSRSRGGNSNTNNQGVGSDNLRLTYNTYTNQATEDIKDTGAKNDVPKYEKSHSNESLPNENPTTASEEVPEANSEDDTDEYRIGEDNMSEFTRRTRLLTNRAEVAASVEIPIIPIDWSLFDNDLTKELELERAHYTKDEAQSIPVTDEFETNNTCTD